MVRSSMWTVLGPMLIVGCAEDATCPQGVFFAVSVHALSTADATPVLDARGEVREGSFADSLVETGDGFYNAAENRSGLYAVHLEHPDYAPWDTSGVEVLSAGGRCPLITTTQVEARLTPLE